MRSALPEPGWPTAEEAARSRLFSPITIGPHAVRSRTWVPAMVPWRATEDGEVTPRVIDWYGRFAEGRPGVIVVEATGIRDVPSGPLLRVGHDRFTPGLSKIVEEVRRRSGGITRLFLQIIDFLSIRRRPEPARFFAKFLSISPEHRARLEALTGDLSWRDAPEPAVRARLERGPHAELLTPRELEALERGQRERVGDLELPHVRELPRVLPGLFARAAARAEAAGFDGVELHFAHAYTMASFLSRTNDRADGYGGSFEGRVRLPLEVIAATRAALSRSTALGARFLADEVIEGGSRVDDARRYAVAFAAAGLDFLSLSKGGKFEDAKQPKIGQAAYPYTGPSGHECMPTVWMDGAFGRHLPLAQKIRASVRGAGFDTPIVAAGGLNTFALAEGALSAEACDLVAAARQSLADPDWWEKMRLGRGHEVRRCAMTNYCEGLDQQHKQVTCRLWDREPGGERTDDGRRRLVAPPWRPEDAGK